MAATLLWNEGFESYTAGNDTITSPWSSPGNTLISTAIKHSGAQSFGAGRAGNGGTCSRALSGATQEPIWTVDFWMLIPTGSGLGTPGSAGLYMASGGGAIELVVGSDGGCKISIPFGATLFDTFSLSLDTWHHLIWSCTQSATGSSNLSIDGVAQTPFSGDTRNFANNAYSDTLQLIGQTIGPSPTAEVYFDDMNVYSGIPVGNVNAPMIRMVG